MATYTVTDNDLFMTIARNGLAIETIPKSLCSIRVNHYASPMGGVAVDSILISHNGELAVELAYTDTLVSGVAPSSISDLHSKLLTVLNNVPAPSGGSSTYLPITIGEASTLNDTNGWTDGAWYKITDTVTHSFCPNLLYYRAQAYPDPVSGQVRLSTTGYGKITNANGVSREGYVGFDFTNPGGDNIISFYDPINNNRVWDKVGASNGFVVYNEATMSSMTWTYAQCNTTNIPIGQLYVRNSSIGSDGITGSLTTLDALSPMGGNATISNCTIGGGTGIFFVGTTQSFSSSIIGTGNTIQTPSDDLDVTGWNVGNNNTIGYSDYRFKNLSNFRCGNGNTVTPDADNAYDGSGSTFGNDQTYTFTYTLRNCNFAKGYLEYKALLSQTGTDAPTVYLVYTDELNTSTWTYFGIGDYRCPISATINELNSVNQTINIDGIGNADFLTCVATGTNEINIQCGVILGLPSDDLLNKQLVIFQIPLP